MADTIWIREEFQEPFPTAASVRYLNQWYNNLIKVQPVVETTGTVLGTLLITLSGSRQIFFYLN